MKRPDLFQVFGQIIPVEYVEPESIDNDYGEYCRKNKDIKINKSIDSEELMATLVHELGHALSDRVGLRQAINHELEEIMCEAFAVVITENFKLSPR